MDSVILLTRPRRFGKTLNMSMLNCFFSNRYAGRDNLFKGLSIWQYNKYQELQGQYPVIFISFASVKADNLRDVKLQINAQIARLYEENRYLLDGNLLSENEKMEYKSVTMNMSDVQASLSLNAMSLYLSRYYGKKVIILLDEYDTPMQEVYINNYWDGFASYIRSLFNATFKSNANLERAVMTGITRVSKESIFSDLNNLMVVTTTSDMYADSFGFTQQEVELALKEYCMQDKMLDVKKWYDGFAFGSCKDIYNPWSITKFLKEKHLKPYWAATSSNGLINSLIQKSSIEIKEQMENLIKGETIVVSFDEQIVFNQLDQSEGAIWSLLLASGYLKAERIEYRGIVCEPWYHISITNLETLSMFSNMFKGWFGSTQTEYNRFIKAMLVGDIDAMNEYLNRITMQTFSYFDTGRKGMSDEPERFYHGFVLGLLVELQDRYYLHSNRESGFGRYDIMLEPKDINKDVAIIMEFKVFNSKRENSLEDTANVAIKQIHDKQYEQELIVRGINKEKIRKYGIAFCGKQVLIKDNID